MKLHRNLKSDFDLPGKHLIRCLHFVNMRKKNLTLPVQYKHSWIETPPPPLPTLIVASPEPRPQHLHRYCISMSVCICFNKLVHLLPVLVAK